ncbi:MAG: ATP-dependent DNA helicase, partial [Thiohalomonadales bacterium]
MDKIINALSEDGPIASAMSGFRARQQQQAMAVAVGRAISERSVLVVEAGTGTGKTYAYLVPVLLQGGKVIISTGTKTLQDQLFYRDLPEIQHALSSNAKLALLKGRSNYLCHYRLQQTENAARLDPSLSTQIEQLNHWLRQTTSGDIAECEQVPEDALIWSQVTSTVDNCLGNECPQFKECFVVKARRAAQEADVVVINHHLFFIDLALKEEGFGEILPSADAIIFDEAHQVTDVARMYFGESISSRQITELGKDVEKECHNKADDEKSILDYVRRMNEGVQAVKQSMGDAGQRAAWQQLANADNIEALLQQLLQDLKQFIDAINPARERSTGYERCYQRGIDIKIKLQQFLQKKYIGGEQGATKVNDAVNRSEWVKWYETYEHRFVLYSTPVAVADSFYAHVELSNSAWIFTSATLSVGKRFEHFTHQLGLHDAVTERWDSPFSYKDNTLLYIPDGLPLPNSADYIQQVVNMAVPVIKEVGGR